MACGRRRARSRSSSSTAGSTPAAAVRDGRRRRASRRSCATSSGRALAYVAALPRAAAGRRAALPRGSRAADGPDVGRPGALPAVPGDRRSGCCPIEIGDLNRLYQLGLRVVAAAVGDRRGRLLRDPRQRPARGRRRAPTSSAATARLAVVGNVLTHVDYPRPRLRDGGDRRRDRRAAANLRPGRAQRPRRQPAGPQRLPPPRLRRARPLRGAARPPARLALAGPRRAAPPPVRPARRPIPDDHRPAALPAHDVTDLGLAAEGVRRIEWAEREMPVLRLIRERFERERPLAGLRIGACLHVTTETANLMRTLKAGGAEVVLARLATRSRPRTTSRPRSSPSTGSRVFARRGEDRDTYYAPPQRGRRHAPAADDGRRLRPRLAAPQRSRRTRSRRSSPGPRRRPPASSGCGRWPPTARSASRSSRSTRPRPSTSSTTATGPASRTLDGILRATNILIAGRKVVVAGYGWVGKGIAVADGRARRPRRGRRGRPGPGARGADGRLPGHDRRPRPPPGASCSSPPPATSTSSGASTSRRCATARSWPTRGHFDAELDLAALRELAEGHVREVRDNVQEFDLGGKRLNLIAEGRLVNLGAAEGHPAAVMDMSFANQALSAEYVAGHHAELEPRVYVVPEAIDAEVARLKLAALGHHARPDDPRAGRVRRLVAARDVIERRRIARRPTVAPYGSWASPIRIERRRRRRRSSSASRAIDGDDTYWLEGRARRGGPARSSSGRGLDGDDRPTLTPAAVQRPDPRPRVRRRRRTLVAGGVVVFSNFADGRLYRRRSGAARAGRRSRPRAPWRYADIRPDRGAAPAPRRPRGPRGRRGEPARRRSWPIAARRRRAADGPRARAPTSRRAAPVAGRQPPRLARVGPPEHALGRHRAAGRRRSPPDGTLGEPMLVAGGPDESIAQPELVAGRRSSTSSPTGPAGGTSTGCVDGPTLEPIAPMEAEFADPDWIFGRSHVRLRSPTARSSAVGRSDGRDQLFRIEPDELAGEVDVAVHRDRRARRRRPTGLVPSPARRPIRRVIAGSTRSTLAVAGVLRRASAVAARSGARLACRRRSSSRRAAAGPRTRSTTRRATRAFVGPDGERPPLVVTSHGGPTADASTALRPEHPAARRAAGSRSSTWTTAAAPATAAPTASGSTASGASSTSTTASRRPRCLVERGDVDPARLAIAGGSAGGYTTLAALAFRDVVQRRRRACFGVGDLETFVGRHPQVRVALPRPPGRAVPGGGRRSTASARRSTSSTGSRARSSSSRALDDKVVPPSQAEAIVDGARRERHPARLPAPSRARATASGRPDAIRRSLEAELSFLGQVFGFTPADELEPVELPGLERWRRHATPVRSGA